MFSYIHLVGKDSTSVNLVSDIAFSSSFKFTSFGLWEARSKFSRSMYHTLNSTKVNGLII